MRLLLASIMILAAVGFTMIAKKKVIFEVINALGEMVLKSEIQIRPNEMRSTINISSLVPGIYFLKIMGKDRSSSVRKFIKK